MWKCRFSLYRVSPRTKPNNAERSIFVTVSIPVLRYRKPLRKTTLSVCTSVSSKHIKA